MLFRSCSQSAHKRVGETHHHHTLNPNMTERGLGKRQGKNLECGQFTWPLAVTSGLCLSQDRLLLCSGALWTMNCHTTMSSFFPFSSASSLLLPPPLLSPLAFSLSSLCFDGSSITEIFSPLKWEHNWKFYDPTHYLIVLQDDQALLVEPTLAWFGWHFNPVYGATKDIGWNQGKKNIYFLRCEYNWGKVVV